jgi:hypothetical protein
MNPVGAVLSHRRSRSVVVVSALEGKAVTAAVAVSRARTRRLFLRVATGAHTV